MYSKVQFGNKRSVVRGWAALLVSHYPLVTQDYPQASLSKLQKLFGGMRVVIVAAKLLSYPPSYSIIN